MGGHKQPQLAIGAGNSAGGSVCASAGVVGGLEGAEEGLCPPAVDPDIEPLSTALPVLPAAGGGHVLGRLTDPGVDASAADSLGPWPWPHVPKLQRSGKPPPPQKRDPSTATTTPGGAVVISYFPDGGLTVSATPAVLQALLVASVIGGLIVVVAVVVRKPWRGHGPDGPMGAQYDANSRSLGASKPEGVTRPLANGGREADGTLEVVGGQVTKTAVPAVASKKSKNSKKKQQTLAITSLLSNPYPSSYILHWCELSVTTKQNNNKTVGSPGKSASDEDRHGGLAQEGQDMTPRGQQTAPTVDDSAVGVAAAEDRMNQGPQSPTMLGDVGFWAPAYAGAPQRKDGSFVRSRSPPRLDSMTSAQEKKSEVAHRIPNDIPNVCEVLSAWKEDREIRVPHAPEKWPGTAVRDLQSLPNWAWSQANPFGSNYERDSNILKLLNLPPPPLTLHPLPFQVVNTPFGNNYERGQHPFGNNYERDSNILKQLPNLSPLSSHPELLNLLSPMLNKKPESRPSMVAVLAHPVWWTADQQLQFLVDISDRLECEEEPDEKLLAELESSAMLATGGNWGARLDPELVANLGKYRKYDFNSLRDLLRVVRNKKNHFREMPLSLQSMIGPHNHDYLLYFTSRFPCLLISVFFFALLNLACNEPVLTKTYWSVGAPAFEPFTTTFQRVYTNKIRRTVCAPTSLPPAPRAETDSASTGLAAAVTSSTGGTGSTQQDSSSDKGKAPMSSSTGAAEGREGVPPAGPTPMVVGYEVDDSVDDPTHFQDLPQRPSKSVCEFFAKTGHCKFGPGCVYDHPALYAVPLSSLGLPVRSDQTVCVFYKRNNECRFGPSCKFSHPPLKPIYAGSATNPKSPVRSN
eukprot:gene20835-27667_t